MAGGDGSAALPRARGSVPRTDRATTTREAILDAAVRLFAEQGVTAVSNRRIAEAAGQGNTAVVGYHFGTKTDLVRAIVARHTESIERDRERMLAALPDDPGVRDWVECLVRPPVEHLARTDGPTWYARFAAQIMTDPTMRDIMIEQSLDSPALRTVLDGLRACLPTLPDDVLRERREIGRLLMVHVPAEQERALAEGRPIPRSTAAAGLIDALVAMWTAPVTSAGVHPDHETDPESEPEPDPEFNQEDIS